MKKIILPLVLIAALSTTSCKKSYNCVCTIVEPGVSNVAVPIVLNDTKSKAETACLNLSQTLDDGGRYAFCSIQ
jgi:hypothetical protein